MTEPTYNARSFFIIWAGQFVSLIGTGLTGFALSVWVYQLTGSVTQFSLMLLCTTLPGIVVMPLVGALVDRWDRRWTMIISDMGAGLSTLCMALLLLNDQLAVWHIYLAVGISSIFNAFQFPAYAALTTQLIPPHQLGRANGLVQFSQAAMQLLAPVLGGFLLVVIQIEGIFLLDVGTFLFALITLLVARSPKIIAPIESEQQEAKSLKEDIVYGWRYVRARPPFLALLALFAMNNFTTAMVIVLMTPFVLSFTSVQSLGIVLSIAGSGMLVGTLIMSIWGGPSQQIHGVFGSTLMRGMLLLLGGMQPNVMLVAIAAFLFIACVPVSAVASQTIWQRKVAPNVQGRVFAIRAMIARSCQPLAYFVAGPLADNLFEPLLIEGGGLATNLGQIIGVGPGRGIGLMFMLLGLLLVITTLMAYMYPRLRQLEDELPDVVTDIPTEKTAEAAIS